jgi:hypothetical protein
MGGGGGKFLIYWNTIWSFFLGSLITISLWLAFAKTHNIAVIWLRNTK